MDDVSQAPVCLNMEDLLIAILQGMFEFLLEIFSYAGLDWPFMHAWPTSLVGRCAAWFLIGCALAGMSVLFLERTWISTPALRIANFALAPIASAYLSRAIARRRNRRNSNIIPRNHFWQAFWFTLGLTIVRFAYAVR
jgi:hypothetical protein